uniref:Cytohesin 4b n=1 Tax=Electrophorus electricus TaxID=8005 RepID=A0AAY5EEW4_ELEEL
MSVLPPEFSQEERLEIENLKMHKQDLLDDIQKLKWEIETVMAEIQDFESAEETKVLERGKQFCSGKKKFNMDPKKGLNYLVENALVERNPQSIAEFLYKEEGLNKTAIGDFLGEREEMHLQILKAFVELHEFSDLNLVQQLQFLGCHAKMVKVQNQIFSPISDTCYILSFAIIMLNTSLHNPNVKDKTTQERFISMNRGINNGEDLPNELLTKLFESIRNEPFKIPEDDGNDLTHTFFNPDREGWLLKLGGRVKTWKRRWFILTDNCLYYFEYTTDKEPRGIIPLENLCVKEVNCTRKPYCLELYNPNSKGQKIKACKTETDGRVVEGKHQSYMICASSAGERDSWIEAIRASITKDPFYDLVSVRKKKVINSAQQDLPQQST